MGRSGAPLWKFPRVLFLLSLCLGVPFTCPQDPCFVQGLCPSAASVPLFHSLAIWFVVMTMFCLMATQMFQAHPPTFCSAEESLCAQGGLVPSPGSGAQLRGITSDLPVAVLLQLRDVDCHLAECELSPSRMWIVPWW